MSWMVQLLGWFKADAARASRWNRSTVWIFGATVRQKFQRDEAAQLGVLGFVYNAHTAAT